MGEEGFRPEKAGEYTVTYTVTDYIGQTGSVSYTVKAVLGSVPVFVDTPVLPYFFVSGSEYILPEVYANDYRSGKLERKIASAEITDASGTRTVQAGETFVPSVAENGDQVKVVFKCDGAETTVSPTVRPPIFISVLLPELTSSAMIAHAGFSASKNVILRPE